MTQLRQRISSLCRELFHRGMKSYCWQNITVPLNYFTTYQYETCSIWVVLLDPIERTAINVSSEQTFRWCRTYTQEDAVCREYDYMKRQKTQSKGLQRKVQVADVKCSQDWWIHGQKRLKMIKKLYQDSIKKQCDSVRRQTSKKNEKARIEIAHKGEFSVWSIQQMCF